MHLSLLFIVGIVAVLIRLSEGRSPTTWTDRWHYTLGKFLVPPLLLLMTCMTVLAMGHHGTMLQQPVGWLGCHIALGFLMIAIAVLVHQFWQHWRSLQQVRSYPQVAIVGQPARLLKTSNLLAAQVGFGKPELVVSQGLLQTLTTEQIEAVLKHEEAHSHYQDPLWFFWLSGVRRLTGWLPQTEALWKELLLLREIRADHWASQQIDPLILAETLLLVVRSSTPACHSGTAFHDTTPATRLEERIQWLITQSDIAHPQWQQWLWSLPILLPLLTMPFHM